MYIVGKYTIYLYSPQNGREQLSRKARSSTCFIFSDNVSILSMYCRSATKNWRNDGLPLIC